MNNLTHFHTLLYRLSEQTAKRWFLDPFVLKAFVPEIAARAQRQLAADVGSEEAQKTPLSSSPCGLALRTVVQESIAASLGPAFAACCEDDRFLFQATFDMVQREASKRCGVAVHDECSDRAAQRDRVVEQVMAKLEAGRIPFADFDVWCSHGQSERDGPPTRDAAPRAAILENLSPAGEPDFLIFLRTRINWRVRDCLGKPFWNSRTDELEPPGEEQRGRFEPPSATRFSNPHRVTARNRRRADAILAVRLLRDMLLERQARTPRKQYEVLIAFVDWFLGRNPADDLSIAAFARETGHSAGTTGAAIFRLKEHLVETLDARIDLDAILLGSEGGFTQ